jgi:hypothetical protein
MRMKTVLFKTFLNFDKHNFDNLNKILYNTFFIIIVIIIIIITN